jgi:hypothetical protein
MKILASIIVASVVARIAVCASAQTVTSVDIDGIILPAVHVTIPYTNHMQACFGGKSKKNWEIEQSAKGVIWPFGCCWSDKHLGICESIKIDIYNCKIMYRPYWRMHMRESTIYDFEKSEGLIGLRIRIENCMVDSESRTNEFVTIMRKTPSEMLEHGLDSQSFDFIAYENGILIRNSEDALFRQYDLPYQIEVSK